MDLNLVMFEGKLESIASKIIMIQEDLLLAC